MVAAAVAAVLPSEATMNSFAELFGSTAAGSPMHLLTPQDIAYNQMLAARLNSTAAQFYTHALFPWQMSPVTYSPPISPIPLAYKSGKIDTKDNIVTTTTSDEANDHGRLNARKTFNFTKNRGQGLYQPYSSLTSSPTGSTSSISPGPASPSTFNSSGSLSSPNISPSSSLSSSSSLIHSATPNRNATTSSRDKSFKCLLCHRSFNYKHVLQNHMRTHTGEKPYGCAECGKRFTRDHHLKTHIRLHTGERPYQCKDCNQTFVQVANLRRHMRVHAGKNQQNRQRTYENAVSTIALESGNRKIALDVSVDASPRNDRKEIEVIDRKFKTDPRQIACDQKSMKIECSKVSEEQSEPEDLSMHSSRLNSSSSLSSSSPSVEDFDDLDDAEALNRKMKMSK